MKIDRLLSIIMYLLNHETTSARQLADRFNCSVRTIQRDMETIELAGIPIFTIQGPEGGYGIMGTYKLDRKLMTADDLYFIIAALSGIESSLTNPRLLGTLEKMRSLVRGGQAKSLHESRGKLFLDFSMMGGGARLKPLLAILEKALESERLVRFTYTSTKLETCTRTVEPMTIIFKWRSWYLYGFCRLNRRSRFLEERFKITS
jgi:predicted DNA-binding transcriptional regulator YafY